jgi:hypothetical protein
MLNQVKQLYSTYAEFCVPDGHLNNVELIERRVEEVPAKSRSALRLVLSYLYLVDGPTNLRNQQYRAAGIPTAIRLGIHARPRSVRVLSHDQRRFPR